MRVDAPATGAFWYLVDLRDSLRRAGRACCCPAPPIVVAIIPPQPGRRPVDLLLCGHHFRLHEQALSEAGAAVFDTRGSPLTAETLLAASR